MAILRDCQRWVEAVNAYIYPTTVPERSTGEPKPAAECGKEGTMEWTTEKLAEALREIREWGCTLDDWQATERHGRSRDDLEACLRADVFGGFLPTDGTTYGETVKMLRCVAESIRTGAIYGNGGRCSCGSGMADGWMCGSENAVYYCVRCRDTLEESMGKCASSTAAAILRARRLLGERKVKAAEPRYVAEYDGPGIIDAVEIPETGSALDTRIYDGETCLYVVVGNRAAPLIVDSHCTPYVGPLRVVGDFPVSLRLNPPRMPRMEPRTRRSSRLPRSRRPRATHTPRSASGRRRTHSSAGRARQTTGRRVAHGWNIAQTTRSARHRLPPSAAAA